MLMSRRCVTSRIPLRRHGGGGEEGRAEGISFLMFLDQNGQFFDNILTTGMYIVFTDNLFYFICGKKNKFEEQYVINKALKVNSVLKALNRFNHHKFNVGSEINVCFVLFNM